MAANHVHFSPSSSEEETSSSSAEESSSQEEHQINKPKPDSESDSGSEEHESGGEDSVESGDIKPKSVVQAEGRPSEESSSSEEEETDDDVSENEKAKEEREDPKSEGLQVASPSVSSLKLKKDAEAPKNVYFRRLWTLEDEATLLKSVLDFRLKEGKEVDTSCIELFCDSLKGKLSFTERPKRGQVLEKIRALKKKYSDSAVASFTVERDLKMKEIADQIWIINAKPKSSKRKCPLLQEEIRKLNLYGLEKKIKPDEKAQALEEKLRIHQVRTMKQDLKRMDLKKELFKLMFEGFQKSGD